METFAAIETIAIVALIGVSAKAVNDTTPSAFIVKPTSGEMLKAKPMTAHSAGILTLDYRNSAHNATIDINKIGTLGAPGPTLTETIRWECSRDTAANKSGVHCSFALFAACKIAWCGDGMGIKISPPSSSPSS